MGRESIWVGVEPSSKKVLGKVPPADIEMICHINRRIAVVMSEWQAVRSSRSRAIWQV